MSGHEHRLQPFKLIERHSEETLRAILRSSPFVPYGADAAAIQDDVADANSELMRLQDEIALAMARARQLKSERRLILLSTPVVPYGAEAEAIQDDIADAKSRLERLQGEISLATAIVEQLKWDRRRPIRSYIKLREAIFAPIRQLPTEILLEIFLIASPSTVSITATAGFPWKLGHVCGRWRDVVLSAPKLWSCVDLGFPDKKISNRRGVKACNVLRLCLARSGQHPLSIRLCAHKQNEKISKNIVKIALQAQNRWKNLRYISGNWDQIPSSDTLLPPTLNLPMLQHLEFDPQRHGRLSIVSPNLESLKLTSSSDLSVRTLTQAWPRITHLTLSLRMNPDDFASTLLQLPELSELDILGVYRCDSPSIPVHLDRLLILRTALENPIIGNLTTPNLRTLMVSSYGELTSSEESPPGGRIIADLVQRSHCSIFRLSILSSWNLSTRDLLGIVGVTPNVEHLDLLISQRKEIWEQLMYKEDLTLLPRLHTLNLDIVFPYECRDVVHMVKSRAAPPSNLEGHGSSPGRLRFLSLKRLPVKKSKARRELQYLDQLQGFGGLKVQFDVAT